MTDLDNLNGAQIAALVEAIQLSFDDNQLEVLLRTRLNRKLADLAERGTWPERVFAVVDESQKQGFGKQLVEAIEADRPDVARIKGLRQRLDSLTQAAEPGGGGSGGPKRTPPTIPTLLLGALILMLAVITSLMVYDRTNPRELTIEEYDKLLAKAREEVKAADPDEKGQALEEKAKEKVEAEQGGSIAITTKFWPNNTVPYEIAPDLPTRGHILAAIAEYHEKTNVRFVERTAGNAGAYPNYVRFFAGGACYSWVGMQGGEQKLSLGQMCDFASALHEIGHTLGMYHEQSRPDRDTYVKVNWEHVQPAGVPYFNIVASSVNKRRPYDYESIMHARPTDYSRDGQPTIKPLLAGARIGPTSHLSPGDLLLINAIYPAPAGGS